MDSKTNPPRSPKILWPHLHTHRIIYINKPKYKHKKEHKKTNMKHSNNGKMAQQMPILWRKMFCNNNNNISLFSHFFLRNILSNCNFLNMFILSFLKLLTGTFSCYLKEEKYTFCEKKLFLKTNLFLNCISFTEPIFCLAGLSGTLECSTFHSLLLKQE